MIILNSISFIYNSVNVTLPCEFVVNINSKVLYFMLYFIVLVFLKKGIINVMIIIKEVMSIR